MITSDNCREICKIIWPWLKEEYYIDKLSYSFIKNEPSNLNITISFNNKTNFHYMIDSIDITIKDFKYNPEIKIKTHAPYFSPEMKARFQLNKTELKQKEKLIRELIYIV